MYELDGADSCEGSGRIVKPGVNGSGRPVVFGAWVSAGTCCAATSSVGPAVAEGAGHGKRQSQPKLHTLVPKVGELDVQLERLLLLPKKGHCDLKVVSALAADPQLVTLDRPLHF